MFVRVCLFMLLLFSIPAFAQTKYSEFLCKDTVNYDCYTIQKGQTWANLFANPDERDLIMRINRVNIPLHKGMKIAIPKNLNSLNMLDHAPISKQIDPPGEKVILVSLKDLVFGAYDAQGNLQYWGPVSGGKNWCSDIGRGCQTAAGNFTIYRKLGAGCVSSKFPVGKGGAPMPYCMFFHGGYALHGAYEVPGYNASHGCVRLFVKDAKWLNQEFVQDEKVRVQVSR